MRSLSARTHLALTMAVTAAAVGAAFLLPLPAMAWGSAGSIAGSGHEIAQTRQLGAFNAIRVDGPLDVHAHPGTAGTVVVNADDNIQPLIETVLEGQTLVVRIARHANFHTNRDMRVDVSFAQLTSLQIRGSGDVQVDDVSGPSFEASITGSGDLHVAHASVGKLVAEISGSGDVVVQGKADEARYAIAGSGDLNADGLAAKRVTVSVSGSGDATVNATESLEAHVAGSGDIHYSGRPAQVNTHVAGSGEISGN